jgi:uncharacterized protein YoxC
MNFPNGTQIGWIADDVIEVVPELVTRDKDGYMYISYSHAVALIGQAVTELSERVESVADRPSNAAEGKKTTVLEETIKEMQRDLTEKDNRIAVLENTVSSLGRQLDEVSKQMKLLVAQLTSNNKE